MEGLVPLDSPLSEEVFLSEVFESWFAVFLSAVDEPEPAGFTELPVLPSDADVMTGPVLRQKQNCLIRNRLMYHRL